MTGVFYLTFTIPNSQGNAGVNKKISAQVQALYNSGLIIYLGMYENLQSYVIVDYNFNVIEKIDLTGKSFLNREHFVLRQLKQFIVKNNIEYIYSRWERYSLPASAYYRSLSKCGVKVLLEIPTYPLKQKWLSIYNNFLDIRILQGLKRLLLSLIDSLGIPLMRFGVDHVVNNNGFDYIWGIPVLGISNGIDPSCIKINTKIPSNEELTIISVANIEIWHGFDRVIEGLYQYYAANPRLRIKYYIVGVGDNLNYLKQLVEKYSLSEYVCFCGFLNGKELDDVFDKADMGVSVLGVHRAGMKTCDSLKSREYCARSIPFITQEAEFMYSHKPFALRFSNNDAPIDFEYVAQWYLSNISDFISIKDNMRQFAENECSWKIALRNVITYIKSPKSPSN